MILIKQDNKIDVLLIFCLTPSIMITLLYWTIFVGPDGVHIGEVLLYIT